MSELQAISERILIAERHMRTLKAERARLILLLRDEGLSLAQIAEGARVSRQAVLQIAQRSGKHGQV